MGTKKSAPEVVLEMIKNISKNKDDVRKMPVATKIYIWIKSMLCRLEVSNYYCGALFEDITYCN